MTMKDIEMHEGSETSDSDDNRPIFRGSRDADTVPKKTHRLIVLAILLLIALPLLISTIVLATQDNSESEITTTEEDPDAWKQHFMVESDSGAVATDDERCSKIAASILDKGGNAMDAAVAATICLGVVGPSSSGLGGGCFILGRTNTSDVIFIDARETAPEAATQNMYNGRPTASLWGGLAVAVPAELRGLYKAYQMQGGRLPWADLITPSVSLAEEYEVSDHLGVHISKMSAQIESDVVLYGAIRAMLTHADGTYKTGGDLINNAALAETLRRIALDPEHLHTAMAATLAAEIQAAGGIVTAEEINTYPAVKRDAVEFDIFGHEVYSAPPPSSGGLIVLAIMQFMEGFEEPLASQEEVYHHYLAEAMKHGFAMRMSLGDPDFVNVTQVELDILHNNYIASLRDTVLENDVLGVTEYGGSDYGVKVEDLDNMKSLPEDHGTSHLSVVDQWGNSVGITSTVNYYFGSLILSPSTGIIFNNQMDDFSSPNTTNVFGLHPFESNYIEPKKRPLSSMSPTIAVRKSNRRVRLVGGASGGPRIITSTAQVLLNFLGRGMTLLDSLVAGRIHTQLLPEQVGVEDQDFHCAPDVCVTDDGSGGMLNIAAGVGVQDALTSRNHEISVNKGAGFAVSQFIEVEHDMEDGSLFAVSDPRKGGRPAGSYST